MLRWDFLRGHEAVTCEVRVPGTGSSDVCVVPHSDVSSSVVEPFAQSGAALRRHAEITWYFKQAGFSVRQIQALLASQREMRHESL